MLLPKYLGLEMFQLWGDFWIWKYLHRLCWLNIPNLKIWNPEHSKIQNFLSIMLQFWISDAWSILPFPSVLSADWLDLPSCIRCIHSLTFNLPSPSTELVCSGITCFVYLTSDSLQCYRKGENRNSHGAWLCRQPSLPSSCCHLHGGPLHLHFGGRLHIWKLLALELDALLHRNAG